jgi:hypothetical protein
MPLSWLRWLEADDAKLVWARSDRTQWKAICWRFGIGRATTNRQWQYGLCLIAWRLNGRRVPAKRSPSFVVERVRGRVDWKVAYGTPNPDSVSV